MKTVTAVVTEILWGQDAPGDPCRVILSEPRLLIMTKRQSAIDAAVGLLGELQEAQRTGSKQAFREALREEFVRRSGASSLEQALATAMTSLMKELIPELSEKRSNRKIG
jgi:hypothetical protein